MQCPDSARAVVRPVVSLEETFEKRTGTSLNQALVGGLGVCSRPLRFIAYCF
jgi:hypothetical protein